MSTQKLQELKSKKLLLENKALKAPLTDKEQLALATIDEDIEDLEAAALPASDATADFSGYTPKESEKHLVHVEVTTAISFDPTTGKEISKPYVQIFNEKEFALCEKHAASLGFIYKVLYRPTTSK